jgi:hypothetical protein
MGKPGSVREEDGCAVIRVPMDEVQDLRVVLAPCPCRATKSTSTTNIRARLSMALGRLVSKKR